MHVQALPEAGVKGFFLFEQIKTSAEIKVISPFIKIGNTQKVAIQWILNL